MEFLFFFQCFEPRRFTGAYRTVFRSFSIFKPPFISDVNTSARLHKKAHDVCQVKMNADASSTSGKNITWPPKTRFHRLLCSTNLRNSKALTLFRSKPAQ